MLGRDLPTTARCKLAPSICELVRDDMGTTRSTNETELTELEGGRELELPELLLSTTTNF